MRFSVAPMMDWTDRHYRYLARLISPSTYLYTEMVTSHAIIHGDPDRLLGRDPAETPVVLQLGGNDPGDLAKAVKIANDWQYSEINLNCGCPSPRVKKGAFGASLMATPERVADCMQLMSEVSHCPVTVKTRIGIDDQEDFDFLARFVQVISEGSSTRRFIIHARKAWLNGMSPKDNRTKPPLNYQRAVDLKAHFPHLAIELNGGLSCDPTLVNQFPTLDGFMIGRLAYQRPYTLAALEADPPTELSVVKDYLDYVDNCLKRGVRLQTLIKPLIGLFEGRSGARQWRRTLSEEAQQQSVEAIAALASRIDLNRKILKT